MSLVSLPIGQSVSTLAPEQTRRLLERGRAQDPAVERDVSAVIARVRESGDQALLDLIARYDQVSLTSLEVPRAQWRAAYDALPDDVRVALEHAASAIRAFHRAQLPRPVEIEVQRGVKLSRRAEPLQRVGVYAPGGRAAYPSSVLMGAVPARVAGVSEVVLCSPPSRDGALPQAVLAAAHIAQVDRVFAVGGPGAIAALAFGTESVPRVDKVVGPGNAYVTEAKRQLTGTIAIDCPAGPSEILILADDTTDAELAAAELIAQAEHDPDAAAVLVSTSRAALDEIARALELAVSAAPRQDVVRESLRTNGALLAAENLEQLIDFANRYAAEHLLVLTEQPRSLLPRLRSAGSIFLGAGSSVAFGDYLTGANHVLPTAARARAYAGLSVADFLREYTVQEVDAAAATRLAGPTALLADAEGLPGHARAARLREGSVKDLESGPLLRDAYRDIELYDPRRSSCEIDLSDNTNLFGVPPGARRVFAELAADRITRYPSVFAAELKGAIADWYGVAPENIATGCGSDDVIDSALRAFCEPGDRIALPDPTFSMVAGFAEMNTLEPVRVPLTETLQLDEAAMVGVGARVTYICSPNNPTGTGFERSAIERLEQQLPGIMLIDEAYADFADADLRDLALGSQRVISLRTMSKAFGLAGLRVGFAIGPAVLIREIEKSRGPYKVNRPAEAAAIAVLREDGAWIRKNIAEVRANRTRLATELVRTGFRVFDSGGNFLLVQLPAGKTAVQVAGTLRQRGVAVRPFGALPRLGECIRVSIGPWSLMERFLLELSAE